MKLKKISKFLVFILSLFTANNAFAVLGDASEPAESCMEIKEKTNSTRSWIYYIKIWGTTKKVFCEMNYWDWGWTLLFQRRWWNTSIENYWTNLNNFLQNVNWNVENLNYTDSYSIWVGNFLSNIEVDSYLFLQYDSSFVLNNEAYTVHTSQNIFPDNETSPVELNIKICNWYSQNCQSNNIIWRYAGNSWFANSRCRAWNYDWKTIYKWMYQYCHRWLWIYYSNWLFWNLQAYHEVKLWWYSSISNNIMERVFVKYKIIENDNINPTITSFSPEENYISPWKEQKISISYTDNEAINTSSANLKLQKWNPKNQKFEDTIFWISSQNINENSANYIISNLEYGKYKYIFSISDTSWNTTYIEKIFFKDYPIITIEKSTYNLGVITPSKEKISEDINITVKTVWAWFSLISENEKNPTFETFVIQNWKDFLWYAIKNPSWIWKIFTSETIWTKEKNINQNWEYNTYNFKFNLKMNVDLNQVAWEYEWKFWLKVLLNY